MTALMYAAQSTNFERHKEVISLLIAAGADESMKNQNNYTARDLMVNNGLNSNYDVAVASNITEPYRIKFGKIIVNNMLLPTYMAMNQMLDLTESNNIGDIALSSIIIKKRELKASPLGELKAVNMDVLYNVLSYLDQFDYLRNPDIKSKKY